MEILKNRMIRDYRLKVHVGRPRVSYRETIKQAVKHVEGTCIRQTGGSGLYAKVTIDLEPETQPKGAPVLHFVNKLKGGVIPAEFLPAIEAGLREEAKSGGRTGYPLVDLKVTLIDGDDPRRRFQRPGLPLRRVRRPAQGRAGGRRRPAGADHAARDRHARGLPGQHHRRPLQPPRADRPAPAPAAS